METIFLTGGSGFVGRNFIERCLEDNNIHLVCLVKDDDQSGLAILKEYNVEVMTENDFNSYTGKIDVCLHLASYGVKYGDRDLGTMIDVNVKLATKVMSFVSSKGCKYFFNIGSCFEYGSQAINRPLKEEDPLNPQDIYAASKVACENILNVYSELLNVKLITLRLFSIYGKYENESRLFPQILHAGLNHLQMELTEGEQVRDYMNVSDVADVIYKLIDIRKKINYPVINISTGTGITVKEYVNKIVSILEFNKNLYIFGRKQYRNNEAMYFVGDNSRLITLIGNYDFSIKKEKIV